nr:hypothetical protein [Kiritimatiellia bacterium]
DETTGQVEFWRRKYFPQLGKFASRDPIGVQGGLNEYGICAYDLINHWDEFGERPYTTGVFKMKDWKPHPRKGMANGNDGLKLAVAYEQALAFAARSLPASKYSYHYLLNSGRPLDISFGTVIEEERKLKNDIMRDISDAIEFADSMSSSGHIKSSDWTLSYAGTTKKWYYALHRVMWSGDAVVTLDNNGCVNMFVRYHLWDPYDFEDSPHRPGVLKDSDYRRLHEVNLADEFLITGKTKDINLRWKQGEYRHVKPKNINFVTGDKTYEL